MLQYAQKYKQKMLDQVEKATANLPRTYKTTGTIQYYPNSYAVVWVDPQIAYYYKSLIPKYYEVQGTRYRPHVTVVRLDIDKPNLDLWYNHDGQKVEIFYTNIVETDGTYFWLNVKSPRINEIREELGLSGFREGFSCHHMTIGNRKQENINGTKS